VALQQHTDQLTEKYDNLKAEYAQFKSKQRVESEQLKASQAQQKAEYEAAYEQLREIIMNMSNSGTCAPNFFGRITTSLLQDLLLLLQLHLYINL
jgi:multidrug resistance efflux pump